MLPCGLLGGLLGLACAGVRGSSAPQQPAQAPINSDAAAEMLLRAFKERDLARAEAQFGPELKAALPREKLKEVLDSQAANFGSLASWNIVERVEVQEKDLKKAVLRFERGALECFLLIDPKLMKVVSIRFQPVPKPFTLQRSDTP